MGLITAFLAGFCCALAYQRYRGRDWGRALHLSAVFGLVCLLALFLSVILVNSLGLLPPDNAPA